MAAVVSLFVALIRCLALLHLPTVVALRVPHAHVFRLNDIRTLVQNITANSSGAVAAAKFSTSGNQQQTLIHIPHPIARQHRPLLHTFNGRHPSLLQFPLKSLPALAWLLSNNSAHLPEVDNDTFSASLLRDAVVQWQAENRSTADAFLQHAVDEWLDQNSSLAAIFVQHAVDEWQENRTMDTDLGGLNTSDVQPLMSVGNATSVMPSAVRQTPQKASSLLHRGKGEALELVSAHSFPLLPTGNNVIFNHQSVHLLPALALLIIAFMVLAFVVLIRSLSWESASAHNANMDEASVAVYEWLSNLPVCSCEEVNQRFVAQSSYDCLLTQPQVGVTALRLEGQVVASRDAVLNAPLARRQCVLFSSSATEVRFDGMPAPPLAFFALNSDFQIELKSAGILLRVRIHGADVALLSSPKHIRKRAALADAPEHFQNFVRAHCVTGAAMPNTSAMLEFAECALELGSVVTCVGELRRAATGELSLYPLQSSIVTNLPHGSISGANDDGVPRATGSLGLTSWERAQSASTHVDKVIISDDTRLLNSTNLASVFDSVARNVYWPCLR